MVKKYKTISIVYGGSGRDYATKMKNMIDSLSLEKKIPIRSVIVLDSILTGDLLTSITTLFSESDVCVILLTADDEAKGYKRIRQNVLFEIGMALFNLGKEKCILLSDFDPKAKDIELPSDLNGLEIKQFDKESEDKVFKDVLSKVLVLSKDVNKLNGTLSDLPTYENLLVRDKYRVDYENLFEYSTETLNLSDVLDDWYKECKSLTRYEERAIYFIERIGFLPIFSEKDGIEEWYIKMEPLLSSFNDKDIDEYSLDLLNFVKNTILALITYVCYSFGGNSKDEKTFRKIIAFLEDEPPVEGQSINPLLLTVYYDYLGLSYMHLYEYTNDEKHLEKAISLFSLIVDKYVGVVDTSMSVWSGFLLFNLARAYRKRYALTKSDTDKDLTLKFYKKASQYRHGWLAKAGFCKTVRNALSIEYFMAELEHIDFKEESGKIDKETAYEELVNLKHELSAYYNNDEKLVKLATIQDKLNEKITNKGKIKFKY